MSITVKQKDPDHPATYSLDVRRRLVNRAVRESAVVVGAFVRAEPDLGWYYECTTAGITSRYFPEWPRAASETVNDGSVIWTSRHPDDAVVPKVSTVLWTVEDGLTLDSQSEDDHEIHATFSGGVHGQDYDAVASVTPSDGNPFDVTIIVPVREQ
jgi:hypothetical protein